MSDISEKRIFHLIGMLYESAHGIEKISWPTVYKEMVDVFSSGPGSLSILSADTDQFDFITHNFLVEDLLEYFEHFQHISPMKRHLAKLEPGERFWRLRDCPDEDFVKTEFYQDHMLKQDIYDLNYFALFRHAKITGGMSFTRSKSARPFSDNEIKAMNYIVPHVRRAFQVYLTIRGAQRERQIMAETLSKIPQGVIVVDRSGKIVFMNGSAEKVTDTRDGLEIDRNRILFASLSPDNRKLRAEMNSIFEPSIHVSINHGGSLMLTRPSGRRPLQVLISPFSDQGFGGFGTETLALLFVYDPGQTVATSDELLTQMYHLTPTEAQLTSILANGKTLNEAAETLGVTKNTIRTHLKHIFSKTETNRQSDLVSLILNGPANVNPSE
ncbi:hypothetical protein BH10ACI3_BH10ACI3_00100 [soil metagenome]